MSMWGILNGTIVNAAAVVVGSLCGMTVGARLPEDYRRIVLACLGLVTITLGVDAGVLEFGKTVARFAPPGDVTYGARLAMVMIACLIVGAIIGTALRLNDRIIALGGRIHERFAGQDGRAFAEGFLTASVVFCVGPLTLLGCLENGANRDPSYLYIKSVLDGFCSLALASSFGWGVLASVVFVLVFQGGLSVLAYAVADPLNDLALALMTVIGGILLLAVALLLLEIKRLPVADLLPALFLPPVAVALVELVAPGLLLNGSV
jgi:uncharacterized membrane protein YqgA involved in biofilm formation